MRSGLRAARKPSAEGAALPLCRSPNLIPGISSFKAKGLALIDPVHESGDISLWEVATLVERGRIRLRVPFDEWQRAAAHPRTVTVLPITPEVALEVASLPGGFHRDPADRAIVETSRVCKLPLLTRDQLILRSKLASRWMPAL